MKNQRIKRSFTIGSGIGHRWVPNELQNQSSFFLSVFLALWERGQWGHYYHYCYYWSGLWTVRWGHVDGEDLVLGKSGRRQNMIWFEEPKQIFVYARKLWFRWEFPPARCFRYFRGRPIPIIPPEMYKRQAIRCFMVARDFKILWTWRPKSSNRVY